MTINDKIEILDIIRKPIKDLHDRLEKLESQKEQNESDESDESDEAEKKLQDLLNLDSRGRYDIKDIIELAKKIK